MARADILTQLYAKRISPMEFQWDTMVAPSLVSLLPYQDIIYLYQIATSNKLASKPKEKYQMIDQVMRLRNFRKIASGTNRVVYKYLEDQRYCLKIAFDKVGMKDNPMEFENQFKLRPFVARMFEVSPCGTVALCERVEPITSKEEFIAIADDIFDLIVNKIIGLYVVDDIGSKYFQNYGIRLGVCPVLLDYPYVYELDGKKMYCNRLDPDTNIPCMGEIDYDDGFNFLVCTKCGKTYQARQLAKQVSDRKIIVERKGERKRMSIRLMRGDEVVEEIKSGPETDVIKRTKEPEKKSGVKIKNYGMYQKRVQRHEINEERRIEALHRGRDEKNKKNSAAIHKSTEYIYKDDGKGSKVQKAPEQIIVDAATVAEEVSPGSTKTGRFPRARAAVVREETPETNENKYDDPNCNANVSVNDLKQEVPDNMKVSVSPANSNHDSQSISSTNKNEDQNEASEKILIQSRVEKKIMNVNDVVIAGAYLSKEDMDADYDNDVIPVGSLVVLKGESEDSIYTKTDEEYEFTAIASSPVDVVESPEFETDEPIPVKSLEITTGTSDVSEEF